MTVLVENQEGNEAESRGGAFDLTAGQYSQESLTNGSRRGSAGSATGLQRPERDGYGDDLNELGLMPAYSSYVNRVEVESFLARKPHVAGVLNDLASHLAEKYDVAEIKLEHTASELHEHDAVRVTPKFHTKDSRELLKLQGEVLYDFFSSVDISSAEDIIISY